MNAVTSPKPANAHVCIDADGSPWVRGYRCGECNAVVAETTMACRRCANRVAPAAYRAGSAGRLYTWSVVERSYPGVAVPFVSAIIDLDDGLTLKGTLREVEPAELKAGLPVTLVFDNASGARGANGEVYAGYHFIPSGEKP